MKVEIGKVPMRNSKTISEDIYWAVMRLQETNVGIVALSESKKNKPDNLMILVTQMLICLKNFNIKILDVKNNGSTYAFCHGAADESESSDPIIDRSQDLHSSLLDYDQLKLWVIFGAFNYQEKKTGNRIAFLLILCIAL